MVAGGLRAIGGDITRLEGYVVVRCVVAGEKPDLEHDPVILAGGKRLRAATESLGSLPEARPVVTAPGDLPASAVIHVAAPRWAGGQDDEDRRLALVVERVLFVARRERLWRVAFSPIGPGFPLARAAGIAASTASACLYAAPEITDVVFVCPTPTMLVAYDDAIAAVID
jgi:O-acetyl-ADP-ribose deacetylase